MSMNQTRCRRCKLLPYRHRSVIGSRPITKSRCPDMNGYFDPSLRGIQILTTGFWKNAWKRR